MEKSLSGREVTSACSGREKMQAGGDGEGNLNPSPASLPSHHPIQWLLTRAASHAGTVRKCDGVCRCHCTWETIGVSCGCKHSGSKQHRHILLNSRAQCSDMNLMEPKPRCQRNCIPSRNSTAELEVLSLPTSRGYPHS